MNEIRLLQELDIVPAIVSILLAAVCIRYIFELVDYFVKRFGIKTKRTTNAEKQSATQQRTDSDIAELKAALESIEAKLDATIEQHANGMADLENRFKKRDDNQNEILIALAREQLVKHFVIAEMENKISLTEYSEWMKLYKAYTACGGNGTAEKLKDKIDKIPIIQE